jgi:nitrate/nitrite transporter NarK
LEGIPAIVFGLITIWYLTDWPSEAKWLPEDEKSWIIRELKREREGKKRSYRIWEALRHRDVILLTLCYFCAMTGSYGIGFWLPSILKRISGQSDLKVTLMAALPYVAAFLVQQVNGWHSDRTLERRWHAAAPVFVCGLALAFAVLSRGNVALSLLLFVVAGGSFYGFQPAFWAVPTLFLSESAAAASIGLINSVGNLGGFFGPMVMGYLVHRTHSFSTGLLYLVASLFASGLLMLVVGRRRTPAGAAPASE